ncbi:MAG: PAS domain S-box protein [Thiobacillus sp.]|nr:PAS domain S-box protein [Thiobacillus sp.]
MNHNMLDLAGIAILAVLLALSVVLVFRLRTVNAGIRQKHDFLSAVLRVAGALVLVMDRQGRILQFNEACEVTSGYRYAEAKGRYPWDFLLPAEAVEPVKAVFTTLTAGQFPNVHENEWLTRDGRRRLIAWSNTALTDRRGRVSHVIATGIDITERRAAETALRASEARFRGLVETSSDWIWEVDAEARYTYASPKVEAILGYRPEEVLGKAPFDFMTEAEAVRVRALFTRILDRKTGFAMLENTNLHRSGEAVVLETSGVPILDERGGLLGYRGVDRDVTERKVAEETLRGYIQELEELHRRLDAEHALTKDIMDHMVHRHGMHDTAIQHWQQPSSLFNGDVLCMHRSPTGKLYVMLGDATGHGLPAALCLLPAMTVFYAMAKRDLDLKEMAEEINRQLRAALPTGHFLAAGLFVIDGGQCTVEWWLGGMPPVLVFDRDGRLARRLSSEHLPLGVADLENTTTHRESFSCTTGHQYLMYTDGVVEASDAGGAAYGEERLVAAYRNAGGNERFESIRADIHRHMGGKAPLDDISLALLDCRPVCQNDCRRQASGMAMAD